MVSCAKTTSAASPPNRLADLETSVYRHWTAKKDLNAGLTLAKSLSAKRVTHAASSICVQVISSATMEFALCLETLEISATSTSSA